MLDDLESGLELLRDAVPEYQRAEDYYHGAVPERFASLRMRMLLRRANISYRLNFARLPPRVIANRLCIASVTASLLGGDDEATAGAAQQALDEMWAGNRMPLQTKSWNLKTGVHGDTFVIVWPNEKVRGGVQISYNSPLTTRIVYDPEDELTKLFTIKNWCVRKGLYRSNLYYDDHIEYWFAQGDDSDKLKWLPFPNPDADDEAEIENPFNEQPAFHLRTDLPYGIPDHADAYGIQDAINKLMAVQMATVDFYGFPQRAALVALDSNRDELLRDELFDDDEDDAENGREDEGQAAVMRSSPEVVWLLRNIAQLVQLPPGDPNVFIQPAIWLVRAMAQITETPVRHMDPQGDVPSGESQRAADAPLIKRVKDRGEFLASGYEEIAEFALKVWGYVHDTDLGDVRVHVGWESPEQIDSADDWDIALKKLEAGVPPRTVLIEAGYAPDTVDEWIRDTPAIELAPRINVLVKIAQAAQGLGASQAMGVIDAGLVQRAIESLTTTNMGAGGDEAA